MAADSSTFVTHNLELGCVKFLHVSESRVTWRMRISRIIKFGAPKRLFKVCLNLLKRNLSCQPPLRVFRVLRVIRDSDRKNGKCLRQRTLAQILHTLG